MAVAGEAASSSLAAHLLVPQGKCMSLHQQQAKQPLIKEGRKEEVKKGKIGEIRGK